MGNDSLSYLSKKFYDPLYDVITLRGKEPSNTGKKNTGRKSWILETTRPVKPEDYENIVYELLDTYEMSRLNFLKQSGLSFLFLPSATHTRFAHSLGTYYLGDQTTARAWFQDDERRIQSLRTWLTEKKLLDDFLIALLLHDVGHFPFSHILENNNCLYNISDEKDQMIRFTHEDVACNLIDPAEPTNPYFAAFRNMISERYGTFCDENQHLSKKLDKYVNGNNGIIDKNIIKYLISGKDEYLGKVKITNNTRTTKDIKTLKNFTSGLIDLDRMDHYRRDSLFMGVKLSNFNVLGLLNDIVLTYHGVIIKGDGFNHVLSLLQSKEILVDGVFEDVNNIAYEAMLNNAIEIYVKKESGFDQNKYLEVIYKIIFLTDEELLSLLEKKGEDSVKHLIYRLKNRKPLEQLHQSPFKCTNVLAKSRRRINQLKETIATRFKLSGEQKDFLIFRIPKSFGIDKRKSFDEWLNLDELLDDKGNSFGETTKTMEIDYHKKKSIGRPSYFNVFYGPGLEGKKFETKRKDIGNAIYEYIQDGKF
ncbi:MAG: HD domain-containing protein [Nitrospirae bacterium]|nr:HD domain-containing protein [Nitrospirota bacterium]